MYEDVILETKDIILKKARFEDWQDMLENLWRHPESAKYMLWEPTFTEEDAKDRMNRSISYQQKAKYGLFMYEKASGRAIGFAGMRETEPGVYDETGIAIGPNYVGKGYGKQALLALLKEAFEVCGADRFTASCRTQNIISHNLQMVCGFEFTHFEDQTDPRDGSPYVLEHNVLTREKYFEMIRAGKI